MTIPQVYYSKDRETPLPVYVGLKAHGLTRDRKVIDSLYTVGMSASYNRTMDLITSFGNNVCDYYHQIGTVCPQLRKGHFSEAGQRKFGEILNKECVKVMRSDRIGTRESSEVSPVSRSQGIEENENLEYSFLSFTQEN